MKCGFKLDRFCHPNLLESDFESSKIWFGDPNHLSLVLGQLFDSINQKIKINTIESKQNNVISGKLSPSFIPICVKFINETQIIK